MAVDSQRNFEIAVLTENTGEQNSNLPRGDGDCGSARKLNRCGHARGREKRASIPHVAISILGTFFIMG